MKPIAIRVRNQPGMRFIFIDSTGKNHLITESDDCPCCMMITADVKDDIEVLFRHGTVVDIT